jgi:hypothetical protein
MERRNVKRMPRGARTPLIGITRRPASCCRELARDVPDPTADDDHIRERVIATIEKNDWRPLQFGATVRDGIVHLSGIIADERYRRAAIVAAENVSGVKLVHDHLYLVDWAKKG